MHMCYLLRGNAKYNAHQILLVYGSYVFANSVTVHLAFTLPTVVKIELSLI